MQINRHFTFPWRQPALWQNLPHIVMLKTIITVDTELGLIGLVVLWRRYYPTPLTALNLNGQWHSGGKLRCHHCGTEQDKGELSLNIKNKRSKDVKAEQ